MITSEPTAEDKNAEKPIMAILIAIAFHAALAVIFLAITVVPSLRDEPEIVAKIVSAENTEAPKIQKELVTKQVRKNTQVSAAASITRMMRSNSVAQIVAPNVVKMNEGPIGLGEGDFGAISSGGSKSMGSGVSFFGSRSTGRRFIFVLDHSASMNRAQEELRNRELRNALTALPKGTQYQVILFGGGALFAVPGWKVVEEGSTFEVTDNRNKKFVFRPFSGSNWKFEGDEKDMPKSRWIDTSPTNIEKSLGFLDGIDKFFGTDWGIALHMAHLMQPPPDVIFFMSDGSGGNNPIPILEVNRRYKSPRINTFAMQTTSGAKEFFEIANKTGGDFLIVQESGKPVKVTDPSNVPDIR